MTITSQIEKYLENTFKDSNFVIRHFRAEAVGAQPVIEDIADKIQRAPLGVFDITGLNGNVLLELGMMMLEDREKVMIIRKKDDEGDLPFNVTPVNINYYQIVGTEEVKMVDPATGNLEDFGPIIETFVNNLRRSKRIA